MIVIVVVIVIAIVIAIVITNNKWFALVGANLSHEIDLRKFHGLLISQQQSLSITGESLKTTSDLTVSIVWQDVH